MRETRTVRSRENMKKRKSNACTRTENRKVKPYRGNEKRNDERKNNDKLPTKRLSVKNTKEPECT